MEARLYPIQNRDQRSSSEEAADLAFYVHEANIWMDDFLEWRETKNPQEYIETAKQLSPRRFRGAGPQAIVENLSIRSLNSLDTGQISSMKSARTLMKDVSKIGQAFYKKGDYINNRDALFEKLASKGMDSATQTLYERLADVINILPDSSIEQSGFGKLCRTIGGVAFLSLMEKNQQEPKDMSATLLAGYDFAITYPLVDDMLHDSTSFKRLSGEGSNFNETIDCLLTTGDSTGLSLPKNSVSTELLSGFEELKTFFPFDENPTLYRAIHALQKTQLADSERAAKNRSYTREDYVDYTLKAALTRIVPLLIARGPNNEYPQEKIKKIVGLGMRSQLHDDILDIGEDIENLNNTPVVSYLKVRDTGDINPVEIFIDSLFYSIATDYDRDQRGKAARVLLGMASHAFSNTPKGLLDKLGVRDDYQELIEVIKKQYPSARIEHKLQSSIDNIAEKRDKIHKELDIYMLDVQEKIDAEINDFLKSVEPEFKGIYEHTLETGKRFRPLLAYITADSFGIDRSKINSFSLALELFHSASLIFDDLPAQDNSMMRRGKPSVHIEFGEGSAQVGGLALLFDAHKIMSIVDTEHDLGGVLSKYTNTIFGEKGLCLGQYKDLASFNEKGLKVEDLDEIAYLKTGLAIESAVIGSGLIGRLPTAYLEKLRDFSYHCGILFQIQDDILDVTGEATILGKDTGIDDINEKANYASLLGISGAQAKLHHHKEQAYLALEGIPPNFNLKKFRQVVDYLVNREK